MNLIPVTKKGNKSFRGMADEGQIKASNGVLIPIDLSKFAAEAAHAEEEAAAEAKAAAEAETKAAESKKGASPADVKRSPSKDL